MVPALLVSLGSALGGYLFGDSLQARTNAQVRAEVLKSYFSVENRNIGKRKQILAFVGSNLAKNDPNLLDWVKRETRIVDEELVRRTEAAFSAGGYTGRVVFANDGLEVPV